ncbi:MAG: glycosyltransferase family 4 protein [Terriglobales bacterium]
MLICDTYLRTLGGSETEAQRVAAELIRRGHRVQVVCAGAGPGPRVRNWTDPDGVPVRIYAARWQGVMRDRVFALRLAGLLLCERRKFQVVYFLMQGLHLAVGLPLSRLLRKPVIVKLSGSGIIPWMAESFLGRLELRWLRRWADRVLVLNEHMAAQAAGMGFPPELLEWMPNPVDADLFSPASAPERTRLRQELGLPQDAPVVMYTGRLAPEKGLPELLQAFAAVLARSPRAVLVLVGEGPMRSRLQELSASLGLAGGSLRFVGRVAAQAVPDWLKAADVFTLVSIEEGFSCALAEAMATGLACVASDIPANRQLVIAGNTGVLVPAADPAAIADALLRLLDAPDQRAKLGQAARTLIAANYTPTRIAQRYEALLGSVLQPALPARAPARFVGRR